MSRPFTELTEAQTAEVETLAAVLTTGIALPDRAAGRW
jgi:hypothetical protein